jgi:hypothetical protein
MRAAATQKPVLLRQWFLARVFDRQARAEAENAQVHPGKPTGLFAANGTLPHGNARGERLRGNRRRNARRGKLAKAA